MRYSLERIRQGRGGKKANTFAGYRPIGILALTFLLSSISLFGCNSNSQATSSTIVRTNPTALVQSVAFSPNGTFLAAGTYLWSTNRAIWLWHLGGLDTSGSLVITPTTTQPEGHTKDVNSVVFSPDSAVLATGSSDKSIRLWSVQDPEGAPMVLSMPNKTSIK